MCRANFRVIFNSSISKPSVCSLSITREKELHIVWVKNHESFTSRRLFSFLQPRPQRFAFKSRFLPLPVWCCKRVCCWEQVSLGLPSSRLPGEEGGGIGRDLSLQALHLAAKLCQPWLLCIEYRLNCRDCCLWSRGVRGFASSEYLNPVQMRLFLQMLWNWYLGVVELLPGTSTLGFLPSSSPATML